jgi:hypothetical protein
VRVCLLQWRQREKKTRERRTVVELQDLLVDIYGVYFADDSGGRREDKKTETGRDSRTDIRNKS